MAIANRRVEAQITDRGGNVRRLPSDEALRHVGPWIEVGPVASWVGLEFTPNEGETSPVVVSGRALIDTGASRTCVDAAAAQWAGLAIVGTDRMTSATHVDTVVPTFAGRLIIDAVSMSVHTYQAMGANLESLGLIALIGRDLLAKCVFVYNGPDGSFSLSV